MDIETLKVVNDWLSQGTVTILHVLAIVVLVQVTWSFMTFKKKDA